MAGTDVTFTNCLRLPLELIEQILEYLADDNQSLLACSTLCRSLRPRALYFLFATICADKNFSRMFSSFPFLFTGYCTTLICNATRGSSALHIDFQSPNRLRKLIISRIRPIFWNFPSGPNIRSLGLFDVDLRSMRKLSSVISYFPSLSELALGGCTLLHVVDWQISLQARNLAVRLPGGCCLRLIVDPDARLLEKMLIWTTVHAVSVKEIHLYGVPAVDEAFLQRIQALPTTLSPYLAKVCVLELVQLGNMGFEAYGLADIFRCLPGLEALHLLLLLPFPDAELPGKAISGLAGVLSLDVTPRPKPFHTFAISFESSESAYVDAILDDVSAWAALDDALALPKWAGLRKLLVATFGPWESTTQRLLTTAKSMPQLCRRNALYIQTLGPEYSHFAPASHKRRLALG